MQVCVNLQHITHALHQASEQDLRQYHWLVIVFAQFDFRVDRFEETFAALAQAHSDRAQRLIGRHRVQDQQPVVRFDVIGRQFYFGVRGVGTMAKFGQWLHAFVLTQPQIFRCESLRTNATLGWFDCNRARHFFSSGIKLNTAQVPPMMNNQNSKQISTHRVTPYFCHQSRN